MKRSVSHVQPARDILWNLYGFYIVFGLCLLQNVKAFSRDLSLPSIPGSLGFRCAEKKIQHKMLRGQIAAEVKGTQRGLMVQYKEDGKDVKIQMNLCSTVNYLIFILLAATIFAFETYIRAV